MALYVAQFCHTLTNSARSNQCLEIFLMIPLLYSLCNSLYSSLGAPSPTSYIWENENPTSLLTLLPLISWLPMCILTFPILCFPYSPLLALFWPLSQFHGIYKLCKLQTLYYINDIPRLTMCTLAWNTVHVAVPPLDHQPTPHSPLFRKLPPIPTPSYSKYSSHWRMLPSISSTRSHPFSRLYFPLHLPNQTQL